MSDTTLSKPTRVRINPSRSTCEEIIRRILNTENKENGRNLHFKTAMDFMSYFESLYPSGPALTKQVQRAIKAMNLAKDEDGFFLIGKTKDDLSTEKEILSLLKKGDATYTALSGVELLMIKTDSCTRSYLAALLGQARSLRERFITSIETTEGLLLLTEDAASLKEELDKL